MIFSTFVSSPGDVDSCVKAPQLEEVLLEPKELAREGTLSRLRVTELATEASKRGLRTVLVWDALMPQRTFDRACSLVHELDLSVFDAIRAADPGVAFWVREQYPQIPLHFVVENGNHNLGSLQGWIDALGDSLERLVLSIELPEEKLVKYCRSLSVQCEVLGAGRILLFYSPRSLLSSQVDARSDGLTDQHLDSEFNLHLTVRPEKSPDRNFPTLETEHGTFMYLDKDQFILDRLDQLQSAGLDVLRIDLRHLSRNGRSADQIDKICGQAIHNVSLLRQSWPRPIRAPFFKSNRTTAQFARMKSQLHQQRDDSCLAEIIGGENGKYVVYQTLRAFEMDEVMSVVLPTGEEVPLPLSTVFRNRSGRPIKRCDGEEIILSGWIKKAVAGSLLRGRIRPESPYD